MTSILRETTGFQARDQIQLEAGGEGKFFILEPIARTDFDDFDEALVHNFAFCE